MDKLLKFDECNLREKQQIYAYCLGNPMEIAIYINTQNGIKGNAIDGFVCFQDIQDILAALSKEDTAALVDAKNIFIDQKASATFRDGGNANYILKFAEKKHPEYGSAHNSENTKAVLNLTVIMKAAKIAGENPDKIAENIECEEIKDEAKSD